MSSTIRQTRRSATGEIRRPRIRPNLCATLSVALLAFAAPTAAQACKVSTAGESQPFAGRGDTSQYVLMPDTTFDTGTSGWSVKHASVTAKLPSLAFNSSTDPNALQISPGGSATSPPVCISSATPTFRFFSLGTSELTRLNVQLLWNDGFGVPHVTRVGSVSGGGSWQASSALPLGTALPLRRPGSTLSIRIRFQPVGTSPWAIDKIYIDPYSKGAKRQLVS